MILLTFWLPKKKEIQKKMKEHPLNAQKNKLYIEEKFASNKNTSDSLEHVLLSKS